jgi:hypothetical protein
MQLAACSDSKQDRIKKMIRYPVEELERWDRYNAHL